MEAHGPSVHLEEVLCYLYEDKAAQVNDKAEITLPSTFHRDDCTKRRCMLWATQGLFKDLTAIVDLNTLRTCLKKRSEWSEQKLKDDFSKNTLNCRYHQWREKNGVFRRSEWRITEQQSGASLKASLSIARDLTDDQWFFGVIGHVNKEDWTMRPPLDKTINARERMNLPLQTPIYPLPQPQDVHESFRRELKHAGRELPSWEEWSLANKQYLDKHQAQAPDEPAAFATKESATQAPALQFSPMLGGLVPQATNSTAINHHNGYQVTPSNVEATTTEIVAQRALVSGINQQKRAAEEEREATPKRQATGEGIKTEQEEVLLAGSTQMDPFIIDDDDEDDTLRNPKLERPSPSATKDRPQSQPHGLPLPPNPFQPAPALDAPWAAAIASRPSPALADASRVTAPEQPQGTGLHPAAPDRDVRALAISQQKILESTAELYPDGFEEEFEVSIGEKFKREKFKARIILEKI